MTRDPHFFDDQAVAGERDGAWTFWRPDGTLDERLSGTYARGIRTGP